MRNRNTAIIGIVIGVLLVLAVVGIILAANQKEESQDDQPMQTPIVSGEEDKLQEEQTGDELQEEQAGDELKEEQGEQTKEVTGDDVQNELDESQAVSVWTTSNLNLRKSPDTTGEVIKVISKGTEIKRYSEENGWVHVKCGEDIGYVSAEYITDEEAIENEETPTPSASKIEAIPGQHRDPNSAVVVIDPGHQGKGDSTKEPNGPGSSTMKARVTSGTTGVATGVAEYIMNLNVSLKLKTELENRGYTVYMTRSTHDVNISNKERAEYATSVGADIAVRIHGNGSTNAGISGAEAYAPSASNPYVSHLYKASQSLSQCIIDAYCVATGFKNRGVFASDVMTGINWSTVPVTIIELGYMSNAEEERKMQDEVMQNNMVQGIANGIDAYFGF